MKAVRDAWARLAGRYAALSRREKILCALVVIVAPLLIGDTLFLDRLRLRTLAVERNIAQQTETMSAMQGQVAALQRQLQLDPDAAARKQLEALQGEQQQLDEQLQNLRSALVRPEEMNGVLERLLARHSGLRLLSLTTRKPESVLARKADAEAKGKAPAERFDLYRHGVEIRLEGNFFELQAYLAQLEQSPQRLLWEQLQYRVGQYPKAEMSLMVYTLSADRSWLAL